MNQVSSRLISCWYSSASRQRRQFRACSSGIVARVHMMLLAKGSWGMGAGWGARRLRKARFYCSSWCSRSWQQRSQRSRGSMDIQRQILLMGTAQGQMENRPKGFYLVIACTTLYKLGGYDPFAQPIQNRKIQSKMLFSFKEFQQTKQQLIHQFQQQPQLSIQTNNHSQIAYEYNKILNCIKFANTQKHQACVNARLMGRNGGGVGASRDRLSTERDRRACRAGESAGKEEEGFYLTAVTGRRQPQGQSSRDVGKAKIGEIKTQLQTLNSDEQGQDTSPSQPSQTHQALFNLRVKIFELAKDNKYLHNQISQLQQSIRYFKRQSNQIQTQANNKDKTQTIALNSMLQKQSDLNTADSRNRHFMEKCMSTQRFFDKSLRSIKIGKNAGVRKCADLLEETTEKMLTAKFYRTKIETQRSQLRKLEEKICYKKERIQEAKQMQKYAEIFMKLRTLCVFLNQSRYGDIEGLNSINQALIQRQTYAKQQKLTASRIPTSKNITVNSSGTSNLITNINNDSQQKYTQIESYVQLAREIVSVYRRLIKDEGILKQNYEYRMMEMDSSRKTLAICVQELAQHGGEAVAVRDGDRVKAMNGAQGDGVKQKSKVKCESLATLEEIVENGQILENKGQKVVKLSEILVSMQDRAKFFIRKQLKFLQNIVEKWLKYDQSVLVFLMQSINSFVKIQPETHQPISFGLSQKILSQYFQNWPNYMLFVQKLHKNPILHSNLTRAKLQQALQRVIKTKLHNPHIKTQKILAKCIKQMYKQNLSKMLLKIKSYLRLGVDIYQNASKYQVLIVNSAEELSYQTFHDQIDEIPQTRTRKGTEIGRQPDENPKPYLLNETKASSRSPSSMNLKSSNRLYAKLTQQSEVPSDTDELNTEPDCKQPANKQSMNKSIKQTEKQIPQIESNEQQCHAIVNYVLAYQEYINRLSKLVKVNK